jgi:hypothetical protein
VSKKLTEEHRAFRDMLSALCRVLAIVGAIGAGAIYRYTNHGAGFYLLCVSVLLVALDNNYRHQLAIDTEKYG